MVNSAPAISGKRKHQRSDTKPSQPPKVVATPKAPPPHPPTQHQRSLRVSAPPARRDRLVFNASDLLQAHIPHLSQATVPSPVNIAPIIAISPPGNEVNNKITSTIPLIDYASVPTANLTNVKRGKQLMCSVMHIADKIEHPED